MLYWSFTTATNWMTIYSDAARTQPVAQGGFGPGWNNQTSITITAMNSSGISGQFILAAPNASTGTVQAAARVYKAPNADGVTYKYMVLNYSNAGYLIIHVVENYNTTSKLWVNEAYQSGVNAANYGILTLTPFAFAPRIDITNGGAILLCVNPRYFVVHTQTIAGLGASTGNSWTGCVEVSRDNVEDANNPTLFPPYGWIQGTLAICSQPYGTGLGNLNPAYACCFSFPRDRFNQTGSTATNSSFLDFGFATAGNLGGINIAAGNLYSMAGSNLVNWGTNIWSGKAIGFPITVGSWTSSGVDIRGRLYGLKILTRNLGSFLDNVTLRCDPQGFLNTTNGVNTPHCVLTESGLGARYAIPK
jgi:hypothetical protein